MALGRRSLYLPIARSTWLGIATITGWSLIVFSLAHTAGELPRATGNHGPDWRITSVSLYPSRSGEAKKVLDNLSHLVLTCLIRPAEGALMRRRDVGRHRGW